MKGVAGFCRQINRPPAVGIAPAPTARQQWHDVAAIAKANQFRLIGSGRFGMQKLRGAERHRQPRRPSPASQQMRDQTGDGSSLTVAGDVERLVVRRMLLQLRREKISPQRVGINPEPEVATAEVGDFDLPSVKVGDPVVRFGQGAGQGDDRCVRLPQNRRRRAGAAKDGQLAVGMVDPSGGFKRFIGRPVIGIASQMSQSQTLPPLGAGDWYRWGVVGVHFFQMVMPWRLSDLRISRTTLRLLWGHALICSGFNLQSSKT